MTSLDERDAQRPANESCSSRYDDIHGHISWQRRSMRLIRSLSIPTSVGWSMCSRTIVRNRLHELPFSRAIIRIRRWFQSILENHLIDELPTIRTASCLEDDRTCMALQIHVVRDNHQSSAPRADVGPCRMRESRRAVWFPIGFHGNPRHRLRDNRSPLTSERTCFL